MSRLRPSRTTLLRLAVVVLLATVPVLVPLTVTRTGNTPERESPPAAAGSVPALPRAGITSGPAEPAPGSAGELRPTTAPSTAGPSPTTSSPTPGAGPAPGTTAPGSTRPPSGRPSRPPEGQPSKPPKRKPAKPPIIKVGGVDLQVVSVFSIPAEPAPGDQVTFAALVRNAGTGRSPERVHGVAFSVNGDTVTWSVGSTAPMGPGEQRLLTADGGESGPTWTATEGEHTVEAWVDDEDLIPELNEDNNKAATLVPVF